MKGLKEFLELLTKDEVLQAEVDKAQNDTARIVEIARNRGYTFTAQDYDDFKMEAVSGGGLKEDLMSKMMDRLVNMIFTDPEGTKKLCKDYGIDFDSVLEKAGLK